jgi:hypothetical protein
VKRICILVASCVVVAGAVILLGSRFRHVGTYVSGTDPKEQLVLSSGGKYTARLNSPQTGSLFGSMFEAGELKSDYKFDGDQLLIAGWSDGQFHSIGTVHGRSITMRDGTVWKRK